MVVAVIVDEFVPHAVVVAMKPARIATSSAADTRPNHGMDASNELIFFVNLGCVMRRRTSGYERKQLGNCGELMGSSRTPKLNGLLPGNLYGAHRRQRGIIPEILLRSLNTEPKRNNPFSHASAGMKTSGAT